MRSITVYFDDNEFSKLMDKKKGETWRTYILGISGIKVKKRYE